MKRRRALLESNFIADDEQGAPLPSCPLAGPRGRPTGGGTRAAGEDGFGDHIGPIDFPMPGKTRGVGPPSMPGPEGFLCSKAQRSVAQGGVQPFSVIDLLNEVLDGGARFVLVAVLV